MLSVSTRKQEQPYHHGELRSALVLAATELLAEAGLASISLREVARRAGVSHNAPYRHFADRDSLLAGQAVQDEALALALDTAESAQVLQTRGATLEMLGSFVAQGGEPCRAFTRLREATETLAIACRDAAGGWTVAFSAEGSAQTDDPGYRTASDERTAEADAYLREVLRATALEPGEERALIERGWAR